jgi:predicted  nucleic acid-binding Zn-ribbon protein
MIKGGINMAGMTNPAIKNLESRMSELEREMSDLREKVESKETNINNIPKDIPKEENVVNIQKEEEKNTSNIIDLSTVLNSKKSELKKDVPSNAKFLGMRTLELTQNEVDNMVTKFNNNNGLSKAV